MIHPADFLCVHRLTPVRSQFNSTTVEVPHNRTTTPSSTGRAPMSSPKSHPPPADVADPSPASPASTSSAQSSVLLVSHTPDLGSFTSRPAPPSSSSDRSSRVVREESQPGQPERDPEGYESWVRSYAAGAWKTDTGVPLDVPDAISAVLDRPDGSRRDAELLLFPASAASEPDGEVKSLTSPAMLLCVFFLLLPAV